MMHKYLILSLLLMGNLQAMEEPVISKKTVVRNAKPVEKTAEKKRPSRETIIMRRLAALTVVTFGVYVKNMMAKNHRTHTEMIEVPIPHDSLTIEIANQFETRPRNNDEINREMWKHFTFSSKKALKIWGILAGIFILIPPIRIKGNYYL